MRRRLLRLVLVATLSGAVLACGNASAPRENASTLKPASPAPAAKLEPGEWFTEEARQSGIDFTHLNGMSGKFYQTEIMTPGVGLFDYDNDGDLDVYLVQGGTLGAESAAGLPAGGSLEGDRLYRNDLQVTTDGARRLHFTDVTAASGIHTRGYGMGVAAGDIDNDGWVDLYVTGFGRNQMLRNKGDGTFTDVSVSGGTGDAASWGVSASFFDYDRDGWLDLFVGNYLNYTLQTHTPCFSASGAPDYCRPSVYRAQPSRLYRNQGQGRFVNVTIPAGLARPFGPALGASSADFNGDGWTDLFVANDEQENQLWINQHDGTFSNTSLVAGVALGPNGERKANMGADAGDFDNDGDEDLFVTELVNQGSSLFVNNGSGTFEELSTRLGVRRPSLPYTGFGTAWLDIDNDGWLDVISFNGHVNQDTADPAKRNTPFALGQRPLVLENTGGRFDDVSDRAGQVFHLEDVGRGAAFGDVDNDGDVDVLVGTGNGPTRLLVNQVGARNHWVGLRLVGGSASARRDLLGARVGVIRSTGATLWRRARADGSYASANDPRVLVGLGQSVEKPRLRVIWPDGSTEEWPEVEIDRYTTLVEGAGR